MFWKQRILTLHGPSKWYSNHKAPGLMPRCVLPAQQPCPDTEEKEEAFTIQELLSPTFSQRFHLFCLAAKISFEQRIHEKIKQQQQHENHWSNISDLFPNRLVRNCEFESSSHISSHPVLITVRNGILELALYS